MLGCLMRPDGRLPACALGIKDSSRVGLAMPDTVVLLLRGRTFFANAARRGVMRGRNIMHTPSLCAHAAGGGITHTPSFNIVLIKQRVAFGQYVHSGQPIAEHKILLQVALPTVAHHNSTTFAVVQNVLVEVWTSDTFDQDCALIQAIELVFLKLPAAFLPDTDPDTLQRIAEEIESRTGPTGGGGSGSCLLYHLYLTAHTLHPTTKGCAGNGGHGVAHQGCTKHRAAHCPEQLEGLPAIATKTCIRGNLPPDLVLPAPRESPANRA